MSHHLNHLSTATGHLRKLPLITQAPIFSTNTPYINPPQNRNAASCWRKCGFFFGRNVCGYNTSSVGANGLKDSAEGCEEFLKWMNGGGIIHHLASVDPSSVIEVGAVIHSMAALGSNVRIGSGTVIGPGVAIGQSTKVGYNVALTNCSLGDYCVIHNGVCIGQDGFGFFVDEHGKMSKKPQNMNARIGNHVEIGANSCIDRGSWRETVIGDYTKIDNLVQIAHNVVIGKNCMLCGQGWRLCYIWRKSCCS